MFNDILKFANVFNILVSLGQEEPAEELKKYVRDSKPYFYIHMSDHPVYLGVNVGTRYRTPVGVCMYPLTSEIYKKTITNTLPFRSEASYIHVLEPKTNNILYVSEYTEANLKDDIEKLKKIYADRAEEIDKIAADAEQRAYKYHLTSKLFYICLKLSTGSIFRFSKYFRDLGYDAIHDEGFGVIHRSEPIQALFFASKFFKPVTVVKNIFVNINRDTVYDEQKRTDRKSLKLEEQALKEKLQLYERYKKQLKHFEYIIPLHEKKFQNIMRDEDLNYLPEPYVRQRTKLYKDYYDIQNKINLSLSDYEIIQLSGIPGLSEDFIREFQKKVDWYWISIHQTLSEDFIREFQDKVNLYCISQSQTLSEDFIREFQDKLDYYGLKYNKKLSAQTQKFIDKLYKGGI